MSDSKKRLQRRKQRIRSSLRKRNGVSKLRLSVYRSNSHIYGQIIDDAKGVTLVSASTVERGVDLNITSNTDAAQSVGARIAEKALALDISEVVFDRGGRIYHGRIKAFADAARAGGLKF